MVEPSLVKHLFFLFFCEMLLAAFGGPITAPAPFIRVPLKPAKNIFSSLPNPYHYYIGAISLGTPPQSFTVYIDTSVAELGIRSPAALTNAVVFPVYDSKKSSTYKSNGASAGVTSAFCDYLQYTPHSTGLSLDNHKLILSPEDFSYNI